MEARRGTRQMAAFTLVEMLAVMTIIVVLIGIVIGVARYASARSYINRARCEIAAMETALESYKLDTGAYPASGIGNVYSNLTCGSKKYISFSTNQLSGATNPMILDPFNKAYNYTNGSNPGTHNPVSFDLWSNGPDLVSGTADDIVNWR